MKCFLLLYLPISTDKDDSCDSILAVVLPFFCDFMQQVRIYQNILTEE